MAPIILCSIFAMIIIIEKLIYLKSITINVAVFKEKIFSLIKNNQIKEAIRLCDEATAPIAKVLRLGIIKFNASKTEMKESMEEANLVIIPELENRLSALSTIAHIAPLLGLLGTVTGMINCFHTIQVRTGELTSVTTADLAGGIYEALLTTVAGLTVAILTYLIYNYFVSRVDKIINEINHASLELIDLSSGLSHTNL